MTNEVAIMSYNITSEGIYLLLKNYHICFDTSQFFGYSHRKNCLHFLIINTQPLDKDIDDIKRILLYLYIVTTYGARINQFCNN